MRSVLVSVSSCCCRIAQFVRCSTLLLLLHWQWQQGVFESVCLLVCCGVAAAKEKLKALQDNRRTSAVSHEHGWCCRQADAW
jgi:hypothetical protein